jgi:hypothetical protein
LTRNTIYKKLKLKKLKKKKQKKRGIVEPPSWPVWGIGGGSTTHDKKNKIKLECLPIRPRDGSAIPRAKTYQKK